MEKQYENELLMVCHQTAEELHRLGVITDVEMREYDRDCLMEEEEERPVKRRRHFMARWFAPNGGV